MINEERALNRIRVADQAMTDWKRKIRRLRRIVAGDADALVSEGIGNNYDEGRGAARRFHENNPSILITQFSEGRNNDLLNGLGILVETAVMKFPSIEIRGLTPHMKVVGQSYLNQRLQACNAIQHNKIQIWDYLMGGLGDMYIANDGGVPVTRWADTLDVKFDQTARLACDVRWKSITIPNTLDYWITVFGRSAFQDYIQDTRDRKNVRLDGPFELEFYYDLEPTYKANGEMVKNDGTYMVFIKDSESGYAENPIYKGPNPNYFDVGGEPEPFLPFESIFFSALPSIRLPIGMAEKALPAQIAIWQAIERVQGIRDAGPAFYEMVEGGMSDAEKEKFREALLGGIAWVKELGTIKEHPPLPITPADMEEIGRNQEELKRQIGVSNYAMGTREPGVNKAREVSAIVSMGSLTGSSIAQDNASLWSRMLPKVVAKGKLYDQKPIVVRVEGVEYEFGPQDPINDYLKPDAEYIVTEDSMRRIPPEQKMAKAKMILDISMALVQQFPGGIAPAFRDLLEAAGVEDVDERMKQPMMPPMMGAGMGMAGPGGQQPMSPQLSAESAAQPAVS